MDKGLIIKAISGEYVVSIKDKEYTCKPIGLMRYKSITPRVGDICEIENVDGAWVIKSIEKRKNELLRPIISNVDKVIIVYDQLHEDSYFFIAAGACTFAPDVTMNAIFEACGL